MLYQTKNPHGGDSYKETILLDYSANTNPYGTPDGVRLAMQQVLDEVHHYPDPYCRKLVQAIAAFEQVPEEWILCGNGAAELIYACCAALKPKRALELAPTFSEYAQALSGVSCEIARYVLSREQDFLLGEEFLSYLQEKKPEMLFLCNPNNPTGRLIVPELLEQIAELCHRHGTFLFLDECFLDFTDGKSVKRMLKRYPACLILKAFTKSYGMAGVRLGYCLSADSRLLKKMSKVTQPWNVSMPAQAAGVAALQETEFLKQTKQMIKGERERLFHGLKALGFEVCPSDANYLLFHGKAGLDQELKKKQIAIRSCENYHGLEAGWYRIAVRLPEENARLLEAIRQVCEENGTLKGFTKMR